LITGEEVNSMHSMKMRNSLVLPGRSIVDISRRRAFFPFFLIFLLCALIACHRSQPTVLTVSAAASLTDAMQEIETGFQHDHPGIEVQNNFGSSGTLARQIEDGAPVDVFISATSKPMDDLQSRGLIVNGTRQNVLRNSLVLIAPQGSKLGGFQQLSNSSVRSIAVGDPANVPAGQYGEQVLIAMHLLESVRSKLVLAKDVRQVLGYVETGNADAGIVYATDVLSASGVRIVAIAPESTHESIVYPVAAIASGHHQDAAREFVKYLNSAPARAIFQKRGFTIAVQ
jgi:molybdate transport system substrate-binding protein